jgi:Uma2 family endonuclease
LNLERWRELLADPVLARLPHRIETDRHGRILISAPPAPAHGDQQSEIVYLLKTLLPQGRVVTEYPLSTDGVKAIDVVWLAPERRRAVRSLTCSVRALEICVEVLSSSNTPEEISEKTALYFECGAQKVWIGDQGTFQFHSSNRQRSVRGFRHTSAFNVLSRSIGRAVACSWQAIRRKWANTRDRGRVRKRVELP